MEVRVERASLLPVLEYDTITIMMRLAKIVSTVPLLSILFRDLSMDALRCRESVDEPDARSAERAMFPSVCARVVCAVSRLRQDSS